ncbi:MAG: hypothetical protein CUN54_05045, partial [Phototrophicales bacterium]
MRSFIASDRNAIISLVILWLVFFWRLYTPVAADRASLERGDFSGQFFAFSAYQYDRLTDSEIPLWNPYNNGGLPFIADTQAAVFYPPRLISIGLASAVGGWSYFALEFEMMAHVLLFTLLMYMLVRRMTLKHPGSVFGSLVAAIIAGYGGFLTSYPPLQLAILEAGIWLPLAILGITEATRHENLRWHWITLTGFTLGLSWMAGHPQTSWFLTYLLLAYFAYRMYRKDYGWRQFVIGAALFGGIAFGIAAVQLLPGIEYLQLTTRANLGFDAKGNGFPIHDIVQFIFPGIVSLWSPLNIGIVGLALAIIAVWRKLPESLFWGIVALIALGMSFGDNSAIFRTAYNILPGLRFFRGQERAAYLVAMSLAILAGMGAAHLATWDILQDFKDARRLQRALLALLIVTTIVFGAVLIAWLGNSDAYGEVISKVAFSALIAGLAYFALPYLLANPQQASRQWLIIGLIVFELFTLNMDTDSNYDSVPPQQQVALSPPPFVQTVIEDNADALFRVDGRRGLTDNFGSLYRIADMDGISPLFLKGPYELINRETPSPLAWELFAVKYVFLDWEELPVPSTIIARGEDRYGPVNLHRLENPRPFALLMYDATILDSDEFAYALLHDVNFNPRQSVILNREPALDLRSETPPDARAEVSIFEPEHFTIEVTTSQDAILSVAHPDYPGWQATIDNEPTDIMRAYGALSAVPVPAGTHTVAFTYRPLTFRIGAL